MNGLSHDGICCDGAPLGRQRDLQPASKAARMLETTNDGIQLEMRPLSLCSVSRDSSETEALG